MIDQRANIEGSMQLGNIGNTMIATLIKKKIQFSLFFRKFRGIGCNVKIFVHFLIY